MNKEGNVEITMKLRTIKENHLYSKAYSKGKKFVAKNVVVYVLKDLASSRLAKENPEKKKINRVGLTVTKKLGSAVVRNRCKRIIREAYRLSDKDNEIMGGYLIVIVARSGIIKAKSTDVKRDLDRAFSALSMQIK